MYLCPSVYYYVQYNKQFFPDLALVCPCVLEVRLPDPEYPVDGLGPVDDVEAAVAGEQGVAVAQDAEPVPADKGDLRGKRDAEMFGRARLL